MYIVVLWAPGESVKLDYVFDPSGAAEKKIAVCFHWKAPSDQRPHRVGPALFKNPEIANGVFEGVASGIHRAEDNLVLQYQVTHNEIRLDFDGTLSSGNTRENEDAVRPEVFHHFERQIRSTRCFVDEIDIADLLGKHFGRDFLRGN